MRNWKRFYGTFTPNPDKQVDYVDFEVAVNDAVIRDENNNDVPIYFTDFLFQPGNKVTGWVPETREMLKKLYHDNDETSTQATPNDVYEGPQPTIYTNLEERWFNIVGRGHSVITIPNYYPEDWKKEILPTGGDFTIYPKEDYDLLRFSTDVGVLLPPDRCIYQELIDNYPEDGFIQSNFPGHPLHYRYTREFWIDGGNAGDEIVINASTRTATKNGAEIDLIPDNPERTINVGGWSFKIGCNRFMLVPKGSIRFRIEFYKQLQYETNDGQTWDYLWDTGIGFYGTARFKQWTYGRARY